MPNPKRYKIRTRLRTATKVQEKQIISIGKWLAEHPDFVIPKCEYECTNCIFSKLSVKLDFVAENRKIPVVLKKMAKRGDHLVRAYAATLLLASQEKSHYLNVAKGPDGEIAYMVTPDAKVVKEKLIGLQYFRDPHLRLLAYGDIAKKRRLAFYSTKEQLFCAPRGAKPPKRFIEETMRRLSLSSRDNQNYTCNHVSDETGYLEIDWRIANRTIRLCEACLKDDQNTVSKIAERVIDPNLVSSFSVSARVKFDCLSECRSCSAPDMYEFSSDDKNSYINGKLSDKRLFQMAVEHSLDSVRESDERILVIGRKCYGEDAELFAQTIATDALEKKAITYLINKISGPIVLPEGVTTNKLLAQYWEEYGSKIVADLSGVESSEKLQLLTERDTPLSLIEKAMARQHAGKIEDSLPQYRHLGKYASFVDKIVRDFKIRGKDAALRQLVLSGTEDTRQRSIGLAFSLAMGEKGKEWQYTREEVDFAKHLSNQARALLDAEGEEYDSALREFMSSAGAPDEITRMK